jgi:hypothetical protein
MYLYIYVSMRLCRCDRKDGVALTYRTLKRLAICGQSYSDCGTDVCEYTAAK